LQVADVLPATLPALLCLKSLTLKRLRLHSFPAALATALTQLTSLNLSENDYTSLPWALSYITTLKEINCTFNSALQLQKAVVDLLVGLSSLKQLKISKAKLGEDDLGLSERSVCVLLAIMARLPGLKVPPFTSTMLSTV